MKKVAIKIREKDKQIIYLVLFTIIIVIDLMVILGWQLRLLFKYFNTSNERKQSIELLESDIRNLDKYKLEITDLDKKVNNLKLLVSEEEDISALIENISHLADSSDIKITQIKPEMDMDEKKFVGTKEDKFSQIEIQIVAKSDFHQLGSFVSKIESAKNFLKFTSLELETDNRNYFIQNVNLSLISYVRIKKEMGK